MATRVYHRVETIGSISRRRALVYLEFHRDHRPVGFDEMLIDNFGSLGTIVADRGFAEFGRVPP